MNPLFNNVTLYSPLLSNNSLDESSSLLDSLELSSEDENEQDTSFSFIPFSNISVKLYPLGNKKKRLKNIVKFSYYEKSKKVKKITI